MAGEVLNMNILDVNKNWIRLKDLCPKNRHKSYTQRYALFGTVKGHSLQS